MGRDLWRKMRATLGGALSDRAERTASARSRLLAKGRRRFCRSETLEPRLMLDGAILPGPDTPGAWVITPSGMAILIAVILARWRRPPVWGLIVLIHPTVMLDVSC